MSVSYPNPFPDIAKWTAPSVNVVVCREHNVAHYGSTMCHKCKWELEQLQPSVKETNNEYPSHS